MAQRKVQSERRSARWVGPLILAGIMLYAVIVGGLLLYQLQESPFSRHPVTDEEAYISQAQGILAGTYPGEAVFYQWMKSGAAAGERRDRSKTRGSWITRMTPERIRNGAHPRGWTTKRAENLVYRGLADLRQCLERKGLNP